MDVMKMLSELWNMALFIKMYGEGLWMSFWYFLIILRFVVRFPLYIEGKYTMYIINRQSNIHLRQCFND